MGVWIFKWILVDAIYNKGLFNIAIDQFKYRSLSEYGIKTTIIKMIEVIRIPLGLSIAITYLLIIFKIIINRKSKLRVSYKRSLPYLSISLIGIIWYGVLTEHANLHYYFTYRNFFFISIGIFLAIYNLFEFDYNERNKK